MRLIDADAVEKQAYDDVHYLAELEDWEFDVVTHYLDHAPTIDAVPVVRCKDCKHCLYERDTFAAGAIYICHFSYAVVHDNHFCSYGERKDKV